MPVDIDRLYQRWLSQYGEKGIILKYPSLRGLYSWFLRQAENSGIDPETIDFEALVDPKLTYEENKGSFETYFPQIPEPELPLKATRAELEKALAMYEEEANKLKKELGLPITDRARIDELEDKIIELETKLSRTKEQLKKTREETEKITLLKKELEEQKAYNRELENRIAELRRTTLTPEEAKRMREELENRARELKTWEKELEKIQFAAPEIPTEEFSRLLRRITKPKPLPRRIEIWKPPPEEEAPPEGPPEGIPPAVELPSKPLSPLPFPRSPTSEERALLWTAFHQSLTSMGVDSYRFLPTFRERIENFPFRNWGEVIRQFEELIHDVLTGRPVTWMRVPPMPWREDKKRYDAIIHFTATKIYKSMEDLLDALGQWGVEGVTPEEAKEAIKQAWKEKATWFTSVSREFLEALMEQKID